ncbi:MAG: hypothetical protein FWG72_02485 [Oscillospiraceae bacterium]|nr:hypothetical protein [Oscillospiraceae bacterium]
MAQPSKGKTSKDRSMKHIDEAGVHVVSATDYTGVRPAKPKDGREAFRKK